MPDTSSRKQRPQILLLGKNGQLGWELQRTLQPLGTVHALDYPEIDLNSTRYVKWYFAENPSSNHCECHRVHGC